MQNLIGKNTLKKNTNNMLRAQKFKERIAWTCAPGGENHRDNQFIGVKPLIGGGLTADDMRLITDYILGKEEYNNVEVELLDLNKLSGDDNVNGLYGYDKGMALVLRNWLNDEETTEIYRESTEEAWDNKYLDPNKYRTELVDGKEVRIRGKVLNKLARENICYVPGMEQDPDYLKGMGTIKDLNKKKKLCSVVSNLKNLINTALIEGESKTRVEINVVEGNRYYDLKKTGIGFHGDTERVVVICITIGGDGQFKLRWQWFKDGMPVGDHIDVKLKDGDVYIMSEKAVGPDWKKSSIYTLRHSAGSDKYTKTDRWEKKRPAYEERLRKRAEKKAVKEEKKRLKQSKLEFKTFKNVRIKKVKK